MRLRRRMSRLARAAACRLERNILRPYVKTLNITRRATTEHYLIIRTTRGRRSSAGGRGRKCSSAGITRKWLNGGARRHSRRRGGTGRICFCEDNSPRYTEDSVNCERQSGLLLWRGTCLEGQEACACRCYCACLCTSVSGTGHPAG